MVLDGANIKTRISAYRSSCLFFPPRSDPVSSLMTWAREVRRDGILPPGPPPAATEDVGMQD
jgi:hypothetical protein